MRNRRPPPGEADLERLLATLGRQISYPPTPALAPQVRQRLAARPAPRPWPWFSTRRLAVAMAALALAALAILIAVPGARTALAGRLGLPGIQIHQLPSSPRLPVTATPVPLTPAAGAGPAATATPTLDQRLHLGQQVTLAAAQERVSFPILLPAALGKPDAIYVGTPPPDGEVTLVYRPRPDLPATSETGVGLLLSEFRATPDQVWFYKGIGPDTRVVPATVLGQPGYWLEGSPHFFRYRSADGQYHDETLRLAGNTLIWTQGALTVRIESALSEQEALKIAASVR